jgi:hypothetical protein
VEGRLLHQEAASAGVAAPADGRASAKNWRFSWRRPNDASLVVSRNGPHTAGGAFLSTSRAGRGAKNCGVKRRGPESNKLFSTRRALS